jgi:lipid-binding SYLF domain-containing protein
MRGWLTLFLLISASTLAGLPAATTTSATGTTSPEHELLQKATLVFQRAVDSPTAAIPAAVLMRATAIAVIPTAVKDGTRYYGQGVVSARGARPDVWTAPAVIAFEGAIPLDLEADIVDFVIVAETRRGLDSLIARRLSSVEAHPMTAGELGHGAPGRHGADLVAYLHFATYFAGVTIDDWTVREMTESNATLYGKPYSTEDIVRGAGFFHLPSAARRWRNAIAAYFQDMT